MTDKNSGTSSSRPSQPDRDDSTKRQGNGQGGGGQVDDNQDDLGRDVNNPDQLANDINDVGDQRSKVGKNEQSRASR